MPLLGGVSIVGFIDVLALAIVKDIKELKYYGDEVIEVMTGWLGVAAEETKKIITTTNKMSHAIFMVDDKRI